MQAVTRACALLVVVAGVLVTGVSAAAASSGSGTCDPWVDGTAIQVPCSSDSGSGGSGGGGGASTITDACTTTPLDEAQAQSLGLSWPPPSGESWAILDCVGGHLAGSGPQAVLVSTATGAPLITPQQLLITALGELQIPYLGPSTAPPRGKDALVGLAEWFWVPAANWHPLTVTVTAGPVWATVTAVPTTLSFTPGDDAGPVSCAGPGTAYNRSKPASAQHTDCSYTYLQPSSSQAGDAYRAALTVGWRVSWTGSGGAGGLLAAALPVTVDITVPVAQGEALVSSP